MDYTEHLRKLAALKDSGILTEKEFSSQKQLLLAEELKQATVKPRRFTWKPEAALILGIINLIACLHSYELGLDYCTAILCVWFLGVTGITLSIVSLRANERDKPSSIIALLLNFLSMIAILPMP